MRRGSTAPRRGGPSPVSEPRGRPRATARKVDLCPATARVDHAVSQTPALVCRFSGAGTRAAMHASAVRDTHDTGARPFEQGRFEDLPERPRLPAPLLRRRDPGRRRGLAAVRPAARPRRLLRAARRAAAAARARADDLELLVALPVRAARRSLPAHRARPAGRRTQRGRAAAAATPARRSRPSSASCRTRSASRGCAAVGNSLGGYLCMRRALDDPAELRATRRDPPAGGRRAAPRRAARRAARARRRGGPRARRAPRPAALGAPQRPLLRRVAEVARGGARVRRPAGRRRRRARSFVRWLGESLDPRELRAFVRALRAPPRRAPGLPACRCSSSTRREDPTVPPADRPEAPRARARRRVPLAGAQLALRPGRRPRDAPPRCSRGFLEG